ncbi:hypothetical protein D3C81_685250 [compost metagenome]
MTLIRRVATMQPTTKNSVISTEPIEALSPFTFSAASTLGANAYTENSGMMQQVQNTMTNSMRLP